MNRSRGERNMMNNKATRVMLNGILLAAVAAVGITAYQMVKSPVEEDTAPEEAQVQLVDLEEDTGEEEQPLVDAGTQNVTAELEASEDPLEELETDEEMALQEESAEDFVNEAESEATEETASTVVESSLPAQASLNFSEDTLMEWPVHGNILLDYDMDQTTYFPTLDQYRLSPAIAVQAVEGAPVVAAVDGEVYSISEDAKTGTTLTMELGNGYQAIYGQLTDLTVSEGEMVSKGTTIGYVAAPTIYYSAEGSNLYFAMKKDGEPIDPILYLP
jgi:murein DD-endopeptidase MepM/ murein hydrolase activator NlpD